MKRIVLIALLLAGLPAAGQGINDLMAGKLVDPKVGQWAWYDLSGASGTDKFMVRQAVVGEEKVDGQQGYWVELEIVPAIGFKTVYKMLVTGPATDPRNVHKIILRQEPDPAQDVPVKEALGDSPPPPEAQRQSRGEETVKTPGGPVTAEHFQVSAEKGKLDVWTSPKVPPMGIVRISSPEGEMILHGYGEGGPNAASALDAKVETSQPKVVVKTSKRPAKDAAKKDAPKEKERTP